jgi:tRNA(fMet)-specific endonuclease VapC
MLHYMLDTNFCIRLINDAPQTLAGRFEREADRICVSTIVLGEMLFGAEKSAAPVRNLKNATDFVARLAVIDFDTRAAEHFADLRAELERAGTPIGPFDAMIAGHARSRGLSVVTYNRREFERVPGLRVETWS